MGTKEVNKVRVHVTYKQVAELAKLGRKKMVGCIDEGSISILALIGRADQINSQFGASCD